MNHLPEAARLIASEQGWDEETTIIHLVGFLRANLDMADDRLARYFDQVAVEENEGANT